MFVVCVWECGWGWGVCVCVCVCVFLCVMWVCVGGICIEGWIVHCTVCTAPLIWILFPFFTDWQHWWFSHLKQRENYRRSREGRTPSTLMQSSRVGRTPSTLTRVGRLDKVSNTFSPIRMKRVTGRTRVHIYCTVLLTREMRCCSACYIIFTLGFFVLHTNRKSRAPSFNTWNIVNILLW